MENGCANESLQFLNPIIAELGKLLFSPSYSAIEHLTGMFIRLYYQHDRQTIFLREERKTCLT